MPQSLQSEPRAREITCCAACPKLGQPLPDRPGNATTPALDGARRSALLDIEGGRGSLYTQC